MRIAVLCAVCLVGACGRVGFDSLDGRIGDASCNDALHNGDELGIDCGGSCSARCPTMPCADDAECVTGRCTGRCELVDAAWRPGPSLALARSDHACATRPDGAVYVVGGEETNGAVLADVEILAPGATTFAPGPQLNAARADLALAAMPDGALHAIAGGDAIGGLASVEVLDDGKTWMMGTAMPSEHRSISAAVGIDGQIYVPDLSELVIYSVTSDMWSMAAGIGRDEYGLAGDGTRIYVIGGGRAGIEAAVDAWDIDVGAWIPRSALPSARVGLGAVRAPDGRIYALGGIASDNTTALDRVDAYTPALDAWVAVTSLAGQRGGLCATLASDGRIFAIGGYDSTTDDVIATTELYGPVLGIAPTAAAAATSIQVSGIGFAPGAAIAVTFDGVPVAVGMTTALGDAELTFEVPSMPSGEYRVVAIDQRMQYPVAMSFVIP